ncbi:hypothetical protein F7Q99_16075 [Streptomyces kaniharaensis]|uniref:Uncharacterized protein n=1 Tax=Streptomyces kaniharaensis TaxID=212423 RepID=A0A6N7KUT5_9ACTN|nr:hypothetical protein [Streptomyces kaniharaensis]
MPLASGSAGAQPVAGFPRDPDLFQAARAVAELAVGRYRDQYFGACSDEATRTLYVMRKPGTDFDRVARERVFSPNVRLDFRDAVGTRAELSALAKRIADEGVTYWKDRGVAIVGTRVGNDGAGVRVDVAQPAENVRAEITARYGPQVVEVVRSR